jgi:Ca-activated chloride channel homolog
VLRRIADRSGGEYFRATDPEALERIMRELDPLERQEVKINESRDYRELFPWLLAPALALLAVALVLRGGRLRTLP